MCIKKIFHYKFFKLLLSPVLLISKCNSQVETVETFTLFFKDEINCQHAEVSLAKARHSARTFTRALVFLVCAESRPTSVPAEKAFFP